MKNKKLLLLLIFSLLLIRCGKDNSNTNSNNTNVNPPRSYRNGVWVINEGNYNYGNSSLSFCFRSDGQVVNDVYQAVNHHQLGDVFESMSSYGNQYYMVINNSQRIEIADEDMKSVGKIDGFTAPRYFLALNSQKAYVTDMSVKGIWIVDPSKRSITGKIDYNPSVSDAFPGWTEQMQFYQDKLFVCGVKGKEVLVIATQTDNISNTIPVGIDPQWMVLDGNGKLWVMCNGSLQKKNSALYRINPETEKVEQVYTFPSVDVGPSALTIDVSRTHLYYLYNGVNEMPVDTNALPAKALIPADNRQLYGLGVDPRNGDIYVSDALDFAQKGVVYRYGQDGHLIESFPAGIIPGSFFFID